MVGKEDVVDAKIGHFVNQAPPVSERPREEIDRRSHAESEVGKGRHSLRS